MPDPLLVYIVLSAAAFPISALLLVWALIRRKRDITCFRHCYWDLVRRIELGSQEISEMTKLTIRELLESKRRISGDAGIPASQSEIDDLTPDVIHNIDRELISVVSHHSKNLSRRGINLKEKRND